MNKNMTHLNFKDTIFVANREKILFTMKLLENLRFIFSNILNQIFFKKQIFEFLNFYFF